MVNRHIYTPVIEQQKQVNSVFASLVKTNYIKWYTGTNYSGVDGFYAPLSIEVQLAGGSLVPQVVFGEKLASPTETGYDNKAHPVVYTQLDGTVTRLSWWQQKGKLDLVNVQNVNGLFSTTYDYAPLTGTQSITDPDGKVTRYEYDGFSRLSKIRNDNAGGAARKSFCYNYAGQAVTCEPIASFGQVTPPTLFLMAQPEPNGIKLNVKVFLQGAWNTSSNAMSTLLNSNNLLPNEQPYTISPFNHASTSREVIAAGFLAANPTIVDWVLVELRSASAPSTILVQRGAFLKADGSIVDTDGISPVNMGTQTGTSFHVAVRHRNHLGVRTSIAVTLADNSLTTDFTTNANVYTNSTYSNPPTAILSNGKLALWAADANSNGQVRYSGPGNDELILFNELGGNTSAVVSAVYKAADFNLNGVIRYTGPGNEENILFNTVLDGDVSKVINQHL